MKCLRQSGSAPGRGCFLPGRRAKLARRGNPAQAGARSAAVFATPRLTHQPKSPAVKNINTP